MTHLLKVEPEDSDKFTFQIIDVKVQDKMYPPFEYENKDDLFGDDFFNGNM